MDTMMKEEPRTNTWIGIDPGKSGAMIVMNGDATVALRTPFDQTAYRDVLAALDPSRSFAIVEHVGAMPGQGSVSMFHFGENFGFIQGLLAAFQIPFELVRPQKWKKEFSCTSDKNTSIAVAKRLFPAFNLKRTPKCTKDDDGLAEALLMAEYGRRVHG